MGRQHHKLRVWQDALRLIVRVYNATDAFPLDERFCLTAQMRRAAISVPSNVAEGAARQTRKDFLRFLSQARASLAELETQWIIARELGYVDGQCDLSADINTLFGGLGALIRRERERLDS